MISIQIDNKELENSLYEKFKTVDNIKDYLYNLVIEDLNSDNFPNELSLTKDEANKKVTNVLNGIQNNNGVEINKAFKTILSQ